MPSAFRRALIQSSMRDTRNTPRNGRPRAPRHIAAPPARLRACLSLAFCAALTLLAAPDTAAQRKFNKEFPAQSNIRVHLHNRSGTIEVLAWKKNVIKVTATMESKAARVAPEADGEGVRIDVLRDN